MWRFVSHELGKCEAGVELSDAGDTERIVYARETLG